MRLSIVIPALNEEPALTRVIPHAQRFADEVVVADGGSQDRTIELAEELGAGVVRCEPGRGQQLNGGAAATSGDVLLFLHADTQLPDSAAEGIRQAIDEGAVGGAFEVEFESSKAIMRFGSWLVHWRTRLTGCPLGDQAQFVRREVFEQLDGFRDWPILEDLDFARRLKRAGRLAILADPARTSARRYRNQGILRTIFTNWLIWALYFIGVSPHRLARLYRHIR